MTDAPANDGPQRVAVHAPELEHPQPIPVAVWIKDTLFSSPIGPRGADGTIPESVDAQMDATFEHLTLLLDAAGATRGGVAMVRVHVSSSAHRDALNARWVAFFPDEPRPARHVSESRLPPGVHVLLTITAVR